MKVWIHSAFDNLPCEGFRKQRFWLMAEAFVRAGHEVTYWTGDFNHGTKAKRKFLSPPDSPGITVKTVPVDAYEKNVSFKRVFSHRRYAGTWARLGEEEARRNRPGLIVAACPTIGIAAASLELAGKFSAAFALDVMDAWPETFERLVPVPFRFLVRSVLWPLRMRIRRVYRRSDMVSGVSARYAGVTGREDYYLAYHGVENALELSPWDSKSFDGAAPRLVYVGNLGAGYDLATVFAGLGILRRRGVAATLTVAGKGPREACWRSMAPDGVSFAGYLPERELRTLLAASDIGIVPLADESWVGLPYKLGDYAKAGLKTVSSLGGECRELLEKTGAGSWYRGGDPDSFADAVQSLLPTLGERGGVMELAGMLDAVKIYDLYVKKIVSRIEKEVGDGKTREKRR